MHPCLRIDEIVQQVADWIKADGPSYNGNFGQDRDGTYGGNQWLLHMALTCRGFREHALTALWRELWDLTPFFCTFPSGVVEKRMLYVGEVKEENGVVQPAPGFIPEEERWNEHWVYPFVSE